MADKSIHTFWNIKIISKIIFYNIFIPYFQFINYQISEGIIKNQANSGLL